MDDTLMPAFDSNEPIKYCAEVQTLLSADSVLLRSSVTGLSVITDRRTAKIASLCTTFATPAEHCARLYSQTGAERAECEGILRLAISKDLCVSRDRSAKMVLRSFASGKSSRHIDLIGIPTCNRPRILDRILGSIAGHLRDDQRNVTVLVVDDSSANEMQKANAAVVGAHAKGSGLRIRYINQQSRERYAATLARNSGVDREVVAFGVEKNSFYPASAGAARNTILLQSVGHCLLSLDDDVLCKIAPTPEATDRIEFADRTTARWFLGDAGEIGTSRFVPENILDLHDKMLNTDAAAFATNEEGTTGTDSMPIDLCRRMQEGRARVLASQMGILGDCGVDDTLLFYLQDSDSWSNLVRSESSYRSGIRNRLSLSGAKDFVVTPRIHSQAGCLGLDNRNGLPPFFPVMRGEDVVLGLLLRVCEPEGLFGLIPRAILHSPETAREFQPDSAIRRAGRFSLAETINLLITGTGGAWGRNSMERLGSLGRSLHELRWAEDRDLRDHLHRLMDPILRKWIQKLEQRLEDSQAGVWTADLRQIRDQLLCGLNHFDPLAPFDLRTICNDDESPSRLRELASRFADFVQAWPALMSQARADIPEGASE
jgi:hypothetical protein